MRLAHVTVSSREDTRTTFGVNIAPLVDVALVLLIVFMAAAFILPVIWATFPEGSTTPPVESAPPHVDVRADGTLQLDGATISADELETALAERLGPLAESDRVVIIDADDKVPYARAMEIFGMVKHAGAETIGVSDP